MRIGSQHQPSDTRGLVRQCRRSHVGVTVLGDAGHPRAQWIVTAPGLQHDGPGAMDQQGQEVGIPAFSDAQQSSFITATALPRRQIYNGVLFMVVAGAFMAGWPISERVIQVKPILVIFVLAVLANIAYCAAYIPDLALQFTSFRGSWIRGRWVLMVIGTFMACAIAYLFVSGMFGLGEGNW